MAHTWDRSLYIMKADVSRAVDNILHPVLHNVLIHAQTPLKLQHALLQELPNALCPCSVRVIAGLICLYLRAADREGLKHLDFGRGF